MGASIGFTKPGDSIQRQQRSYRTFTDQHGRQFEAVVDVRNGMPIGEFTPKGCKPPWLPAMKWAQFRHEHDVTFVWDYEPLAAELSAGAAEYYADAGRIALEHNKPEPEVGGPVDRSIRNVLGKPPLSPAIALACMAGDPWALGVPGAVDSLGLKVILEQGVGANAKELMQAIRERLAGQATEKAVALVPEVERAPERVERARSITDVDEDAPIEPVTYNAFVKACRKRGMAMPDIAAAWHDQKALQATG